MFWVSFHKLIKIRIMEDRYINLRGNKIRIKGHPSCYAKILKICQHVETKINIIAYILHTNESYNVLLFSLAAGKHLTQLK